MKRATGLSKVRLDGLPTQNYSLPTNSRKAIQPHTNTLVQVFLELLGDGILRVGSLDLSNLLSARAARAKALCLAIADCELDDAIFIMEGVLDQLRGGPPVAYFQNLPAEAEDWARFASRAELRAYAIVALAGMTPGGRAAVFHHFSITPAP